LRQCSRRGVPNPCVNVNAGGSGRTPGNEVIYFASERVSRRHQARERPGRPRDIRTVIQKTRCVAHPGQSAPGEGQPADGNCFREQLAGMPESQLAPKIFARWNLRWYRLFPGLHIRAFRCMQRVKVPAGSFNGDRRREAISKDESSGQYVELSKQAETRPSSW